MSTENENRFEKILLFKRTNMAHILEKIYKSHEIRDIQANSAIAELTSAIQNSNVQDLMALMPVIKDFLNAAIKNDDQLVKLANLVNKVIDTNTQSKESNTALTEEDQKALDSIMTEYNLLQLNPRENAGTE